MKKFITKVMLNNRIDTRIIPAKDMQTVLQYCIEGGYKVLSCELYGSSNVVYRHKSTYCYSFNKKYYTDRWSYQ